VALDAEALRGLDAPMLEDLFQQAHHQIFLHGGTAGQKIEAVSFRLTATRPIRALPAFRERSDMGERPAKTPITLGQEAAQDARLYASSDLPVGQPVSGTALIEGYSATIYLPEGWSVTRDGEDNLTIERGQP